MRPNSKVPNDSDEENSGTDCPGKITKQVLRSNESCLDNKTYEEITRIMENLDLKCTEFGETNRDLLKQHLFSTEWRGSSAERVKDMINVTVTKYRVWKRKLIQSYSDLETIAQSKSFKQELDKLVNKSIPNYFQELQKRIKYLNSDETEIEIVVTGETSAGKSCFLNILLGIDILPSSVLHMTSCLCRLHDSLERHIRFVSEEGKLKQESLRGNPNEVKQKLKEILGPVIKDHENDKRLNVVDIYWPIPLLQENIVLVDTPGIGEEDTLTQQVIEQVPNAAGYIFVIDSSRAGGIQEDRIVRLFKEIKKSADEKGSKMKDFGNVLFVCNKWDSVDKEEREQVWQDTHKKLTKHCGLVEHWQIVKFNARLELQLLEWKANQTPYFKELLVGVEQLMTRTLERRIGDNYRWISKLAREVQHLIDASISAKSLSREQLNREVASARKKLDHFEKILSRRCKESEEFIETMKEEVTQNFQNYLQDPERTAAVSEWDEKTAPQYKDLKRVGPKLIEEKFQKVVTDWIQSESLQRKIKLVDEKRKDVQEEIKLCYQSISELQFGSSCADLENRDAGSSICVGEKDSLHFNAGGKAVVVILSPLILVLGLIGIAIGVLAVPFLIALHKMSPGEKSANTMRMMSLEAIKRATRGKALKNFFSDSFEGLNKKWVARVKIQNSNKINSMRMCLDKLMADTRSQTEILQIFESMHQQLEKPLKNLKKAYMEYYSQGSVPLKSLAIQEAISSTHISHTISSTRISHLHGVDTPDHVTLRVVHPNFVTFVLQGFWTIRSMNHKNFLSPKSVVYTTSLSEEYIKRCGCSGDSFRLLVEPCIGDLESYVFGNPNNQGFKAGDSNEEFFLKMASGIMDGLFYIHSIGSVHGSLELSSVLLTVDMTPKLCDINILPSKRQHDRCEFHTAPEVLQGKHYYPAADVYSYGILLWELWYGRHATKRQTSKNSVCEGERPEFGNKPPKLSIIKLVSACWSEDPSKRPSANVWSDFFKEFS